MKRLESLTKYVVSPNIRFYGGFIYDGEDIFLCDDKEKSKDYYLRVKQTIENNVLISDITKRYKLKNGKKIKEKSHLEIEIEKGQKLVYIEGIGFTISEYKMIEIDEAIKYYKILKNGE